MRCVRPRAVRRGPRLGPAVVALATVCAAFPAVAFLGDAAVRALLVERTSSSTGPPGIAVALVTPHAVRFLVQGRADAGGTAINPDTGFEIGSVTKTMTAYLAVDAVTRGRLGLDDPLQRILPQGAPRVSRLDGDIRLIDLLTHTSGLPRLPPNLGPWGLFNKDPYADYDETRLGKRSRVGLAWLTTRIGTRSIVWHNGMTGGFASMLAIDPATSQGVVVLANAAISMDALAFQILGIRAEEASRRTVLVSASKR